MNLTFRCDHCGASYSVTDRLAGRKVRCLACGRIERIAMPVIGDPRSARDEYALAAEPLPSPPLRATSGTIINTSGDPTRPGRRPRPGPWRRLIRAGALESSLLERESAGLILLSAADLLITYALLQRGPSFYESNPVAQWFFARWNIAGMTLFKFAVMALVVVIGEVVERHRPGWGRTLLASSCLVTAGVVWYSLRLLWG